MEGKLPPAKMAELNRLRSGEEIAAYVETHDMSPVWGDLDPVIDPDSEAFGDV